MKNLLKIALSIGFCLMFCCLSIGYASLNDQLYVSGSVSYVPEETKPTPTAAGTFYASKDDNDLVIGSSKAETRTIYYQGTENGLKIYTFETVPGYQYHVFTLTDYSNFVFYVEHDNLSGTVQTKKDEDDAENAISEEVHENIYKKKLYVYGNN